MENMLVYLVLLYLVIMRAVLVYLMLVLHLVLMIIHLALMLGIMNLVLITMLLLVIVSLVDTRLLKWFKSTTLLNVLFLSVDGNGAFLIISFAFLVFLRIKMFTLYSWYITCRYRAPRYNKNNLMLT